MPREDSCTRARKLLYTRDIDEASYSQIPLCAACHRVMWTQRRKLPLRPSCTKFIRLVKSGPNIQVPKDLTSANQHFGSGSSTSIVCDSSITIIINASFRHQIADKPKQQKDHHQIPSIMRDAMDDDGNSVVL